MSNTISAATTYATDSTATTDALVLDTGSDTGFDFFSLEDPNIAVTQAVNSYKEERSSRSGKKEDAAVEPDVDEDSDDIEDQDEEDDLDFDELEGDDEESDEEDDSEEGESKPDDSEPEEEEVDYEGYEVTLPSGEVIKLSEAVKGFKNAQALEEERQAFESAKGQFEEASKDLGNYLELAKLEAARVIEDYADFDWAGLARTDPAAYVDNKEFLEKYQERYNEIVDAQKNLIIKREAEQAAAIEVKARECVTVLSRDIAGWGPELYKQLMQYGVVS